MCKTILSLAVIAAVALICFRAPRISHADPPTVCTNSYAFPNQGAAELTGYVDNTFSGGVVYEPTAPGVQLRRGAAVFQTKPLDTMTMAYRVAASINLDGNSFPDIVVANRVGQGLRTLINETFMKTAPVWSDPTATREPKFKLISPPEFFGQTGLACSISLVVGDFDNDGDEDIVRIRCDNNANPKVTGLDFFANTAGSLPITPVAAHSNPNVLGYLDRSSTAMATTDWNNDGNLDIMVGNNASTSTGSGQVFILLGDGMGQFTELPPLLSGISTSGGSPSGDPGPATIALGDFNGDTHLDLVVSSPNAASSSANAMRIYQSDGASGFDPPRSLPVPTGGGHAQALLAEDFNQDGHVDLMWTVDDDSPQSSQRGLLYYWQNDGDGTPFDGIGPNPSPVASGPAIADLDGAVAFDYDNDPLGTLDLFIGDTTSLSNSTNFVIANRTSTSFVTCGNLVSGVISLGPVSSTSMVIQSVRLSPNNVTIPSGTSVTYSMSIESPANWQVATGCATGPSSDRCVTFPPSSNREVQWRAELCTTDPTNPAATPTIGEIGLEMEYVPGSFHFRAGVVAQNGIVYAAAFEQPGNRGKVFALDGDLTSPNQLFEVADKIDAMTDSSRNLYTTKFTDPTDIISFTTPASNHLRTTLQVGSTSAANTIVNWQRSKRFSGGGGSSPSRLGSIINSTPAVLNPPGLPAHYTFLESSARTEIDTFVAANSSREQLLLFGSMDGALHAINVDPNDATAATNGTEAWGFIPAAVAQEFGADMLRSIPEIYVDGAPSLADIYDNTSNSYKTVVVTGGGQGSSAVFALDVTDTLAVTPKPAPTPLWSTILPNAGNATSKPAIIRVDNTTPTDKQGAFMGVFTTGPSDSNLPTDGLRVVGVNLEDGATQWFFDAVCPVTTSITAFETDDTPNTSTIDGFTDQIAFGDACGNVYVIKVNDPGLFASASPPVLAKTIGTPIGSAVDADGDPIRAIFQTALNAPINAQQPIYGSISARPDDTTRLALFFGTGGDETIDPALPNAFYAIYPDDGTVRSTLVGQCSGGRCEKFYGGSIVTETQIIISATVDPAGGSSCDLGSSRLILADISDPIGGSFTFNPANEIAISSAIVSPLFAAANAIYIATQDGKVLQVGETNAPTAGSAPTQGSTTGSGSIKGEYIAVSGWRQVLY